MPGCKDCRGVGGSSYNRIDDSLKLYSPELRKSGVGGSSETSRIKKTGSCRSSFGNCKDVCNMRGSCIDQFKGYYSNNSDSPLIRRYEDQPWFRNRIVQAEWKGFVDQLVTPTNIGCRLLPGPDDWAFKCHKARALVGPTVPCVWELPEQDECAATQYGTNRDWRRYNDDQRMEGGDINCGCNGQPTCNKQSSSSTCEWPPYMGKKYGARYMAWGNPTGMMFPRARVFNYQSYPKC